MTDEELWVQFQGLTLPAAEWMHRAHLRVAWMHLDRFAIYEAHLRLRAGILRLNAVHGLEETPQRGYHETLTHAWLCLVAVARASERGVGKRASDSAAFCDAHPELLDRELPLRFYSRERLFSTEARAVLVAPDRERLPDER